MAKGVAYLDTQQNTNGSFGTAAPISETGTALLAYGVLANGKFSSLSAAYQTHVKNAITYLLAQQDTTAADTNKGSWADGGQYFTYSTGLALAGLSAFQSVNAATPAAITLGRAFLTGEFQAPTFETCTTAQSDTTSAFCGGWNYEKDPGRSDESNTGYAMFGLHETGGVPAGIQTVDTGWQNNVQADTTTNATYAGTHNDGGASYQPSEVAALDAFSSNANDTGSMLFSYDYDGTAKTDARVSAGLKFGQDILSEYELEKGTTDGDTMVYHSGASEDGTSAIGTGTCDWGTDTGEGGFHYSMFSLTKGLGGYITPSLTDATNWYAKVVDLLLNQQATAGSWPQDGRDDASAVFATGLSVAALGLVAVQTTPTVTVTPPSSPTVGNSMVFTATVAPPTPTTPTPTGTITWTVTGPGSTSVPCASTTPLASGSGNTATATCTVANAQAGTYSVTAAYSGDTNYTSAHGSTMVTLTSNKTATTTATSLSGGGQSGTSISVPVSTPVTDHATLSGTNASTATGSVTYDVYSNSSCATAVSTGTPQAITTPGTLPASSAVILANAATYYWRASYSGDAKNQASMSVCGTAANGGEVETVASTTATSLSTALSVPGEKPCNHGWRSGPDQCGQGGYGGQGGRAGGHDNKAKAKAKIENRKSCRDFGGRSGRNNWGDRGWGGCGGGEGGGSGPQPPKPLTVSSGTAVIDSATLSGAKASMATGTVAYSVYSNGGCMGSPTASGGTVSVTAGNIPSSNTVSLPTPGTYYWQASYSGDGANGPSASACGSEIETVTPAPTKLSTMLLGGGSFDGGWCWWLGNAIKVFAGSSVTDTATLSGLNSSSAGGTVTYTVYSDPWRQTVAADGGTVPVTNGSVPISSLVTLTSPGTYFWQATYSGDALNAPSTSSWGSEVEIVFSVPKCKYGWNWGWNSGCKAGGNGNGGGGGDGNTGGGGHWW